MLNYAQLKMLGMLITKIKLKKNSKNMKKILFNQFKIKLMS